MFRPRFNFLQTFAKSQFKTFLRTTTTIGLTTYLTNQILYKRTQLDEGKQQEIFQEKDQKIDRYIREINQVSG